MLSLAKCGLPHKKWGVRSCIVFVENRHTPNSPFLMGQTTVSSFQAMLRTRKEFGVLQPIRKSKYTPDSSCSMSSGTFLTPSWAYLGPSWVQLAAILSQLKAIEGHLGAMFHSSSAILQLLATKMRPESEKKSKKQQQQQILCKYQLKAVMQAWRVNEIIIYPLSPQHKEKQIYPPHKENLA